MDFWLSVPNLKNPHPNFIYIQVTTLIPPFSLIVLHLYRLHSKYEYTFILSESPKKADFFF